MWCSCLWRSKSRDNTLRHDEAKISCMQHHPKAGTDTVVSTSVMWANSYEVSFIRPCTVWGYLHSAHVNWFAFWLGFPRLWKVLKIFCKISRTWKVLENDFLSGISWKLNFKVLEFAGTRMQWCGWENIHVRTPLVFTIRSYSDETFLFATCDSDEHCSMDATVTVLYVELVTGACLYLHDVGNYDRVLEIHLGSWKSSGIYFGQDCGNFVE